MKNKNNKVFCIIPAAGVGARMQSSTPKQYLGFRQSTVLDATLSRLLDNDLIDKLVVVIQANDEFWPNSRYFSHDKIIVAKGGVQRADSVLNGIGTIKPLLTKGDWLLVHDAARPCVKVSDIETLINTCIRRESGAILATRINDTVKKESADGSISTLDRASLWRALTPQMFKADDLEKALVKAKMSGSIVTDEASAIEQTGKQVHIVEASADNIKITESADLDLANFYINQQEKKSCE
ncbi:MAG: 2-C-methyl-D-erythritol 4-phosphate cytidylyltransferase [Cycloclasticus sp.]|nr:2-C-methyl-D-erythritol 4-phosphate cytidylyltransferase [Cycloclasticus sp.]MBQ0789105.1 2-C-methyl-D-erythritol 4-phosphate cytidylyltransferase [Cycloclasticus sp.]